MKSVQQSRGAWRSSFYLKLISLMPLERNAPSPGSGKAGMSSSWGCWVPCQDCLNMLFERKAHTLMLLGKQISALEDRFDTDLVVPGISNERLARIAPNR